MKSFKQINEGRPSQRHPLEGHEYHKKSNEALVGIAKDAHKAAEAMKSHNTTAENKYRDQANDSATVRYFRQKNGMPDWYKKKYGHMKEEVEQIDELSKDTLYSYVRKSEKNQGDQFDKIGKGIRDNDPKSANKAGHKFSMRSFGQNRAEKRLAKEEVEQIEEKSEEAYNHYKKQVLPIYKKHGLSPEFAKAVNNHVAKHGSYQVWNHHGDAEGQDPHWFDSEKQKVKSIKQKRGYEISEEFVDEAKEKTEYDYEGDMARGQLQSIISNAQRVHDMLEDNDNIAEWVQSKITLAEDYISTVANYMMSEVDEQFNPTRHTVEKDSPPSKDKVASANKQYADMAAARKKKLPQGADFAAQRRKERLSSNGRMDEGKDPLPRETTKDGGSFVRSGKTATHYSGKKTYEYRKFDKEGKETGERHYRDAQGNHMGEAVEPPFTPNKPKTSALPGKSGIGYSTARHLARMAMQKQVDKLKKPVKESIEESRKAQIVKDIVKKKKVASEDTFQKDPELSSSLTKTE